MYYIKELWFYPIKGCAGIQTQTLVIDHRGPSHDREWMFVDSNLKFITQREFPKLALIKTAIDGDSLLVEFNQLKFALDMKAVSRAPEDHSQVQIWGSSVAAQTVVSSLNIAVSEFLGAQVQLVRHSPLTQRLLSSINPDFQNENKFSDSMPINFFSTASLTDLNFRLTSQGQSEIPATRFRGNLILTADIPFVEDTWKRIKIGDVLFSQPKKCARCPVITIDQHTGEKRGPEPLKTLASFRRDGNKVYFGHMMIPENAGVLRVGQSVEVLA